MGRFDCICYPKQHFKIYLPIRSIYINIQINNFIYLEEYGICVITFDINYCSIIVM